MAFLDNSGDIILDAVLTDTGRMRMARGDGSFRVTKFALGDDEINYKLYDKSLNTAYRDLQILQTPIFEAFTNNIATMNSKLISIPRTDILYLPVLKINDISSGVSNYALSTMVNKGYILAADTFSYDKLVSFYNFGYKYSGTKITSNGIFNGASPAQSLQVIQIDQGIDNTKILTLDSDLVESQFLLEIDNTLASISDVNGRAAETSYIDDDNIAGYYFSPVDTNFITPPVISKPKTISGPLGITLKFTLMSSMDIQTMNSVFDRMGTNITSRFTDQNGSAITFTDFSSIQSISSNIVVSGLTTGYSIQIPIVIIKFIK